MKALLVVLVFQVLFSSVHALSMGWESTWNDILQGGSPRWKVDDASAKEQALRYIVDHCEKKDSPLNIFVPLAGDDPFVRIAWENGHSVTTIDLVPASVGLLRETIPGEWSSRELSSKGGHTEWEHSSQRATFLVGDALKPLDHLKGKFDAVYDKDSFGALELSMRTEYSARIAEYLRPGGILYTEVKNKPEESRGQGPPFHVEKDDILESFGSCFEYVKDLGKVYELSMPGMSQMGHILRRLPK